MRQRRHAFTLVELLVVIGVIALLISILMPALNSARGTARLVSCQSNFKQIHNAVLFYANANQGYLPYASHPSGWQPQYEVLTSNAVTFLELSQYLGYTPTDRMDTNAAIAPVFRCTEGVAADEADVVWAPLLVRDIKFNIRAFPGTDQVSASMPAAQGGWMTGEYPQRKLASIRNGAEKIAFWEGPQLQTWNASSEPGAISMDGWRWSWGHQWCDPSKADWDQAHLKDLLQPGTNRDAVGWWECDVRFRHKNQTTTPVAFFDGHVEARKLSDQRDSSGKKLADIKVGEMCVTHHSQR